MTQLEAGRSTWAMEQELFPALCRWHGEVRAGESGQDPKRPATWHLDPLWQAACWEAAAQEAVEDGQLDAAERHLEQARTIIAAAVQGTG